jgi:hypothetical protein
LAGATALFASVTGARWHHDDLRHGGDQAQDARDRRTPLDAGRARLERRGVRGGRWIDRNGLAVGRDERGRAVRIPVTLWLSRHTVRDHVKAVFSKLGVKSRPELTAKLFAEHFLPNFDTNA